MVRDPKLFAIPILLLVALTVFGPMSSEVGAPLGLPEAHANPTTWSVKSDTNFFNVTNDYYKAVIRRDTLANHQYYGAIEYLYLNGTQDVAGAAVVGGHKLLVSLEDFENNQGIGYRYNLWAADAITPESISLVANTTSYAVIYVSYHHPTYRIQEWYTFYSNQPYFLVSFSETWTAVPVVPQEQNQAVIFLNNAWATNCTYLDATGAIQSRTSGDITAEMSSYGISQKTSKWYWLHARNSTRNEGIGVIYLPNLPKYPVQGVGTQGMPFGGMLEWQADLLTTPESDSRHYYYPIPGDYVQTSYLFYVTPTYTAVNNMASNMYSAHYDTLTALQRRAYAINAAGKYATDGYLFLLRADNGWQYSPVVQLDGQYVGTLAAPGYVNATNTYNLLGSGTGMDISSVTTDTTNAQSANMTVTRTRYNLKADVIWQLRSGAATYVKVNFTATPSIVARQVWQNLVLNTGSSTVSDLSSGVYAVYASGNAWNYNGFLIYGVSGATPRVSGGNLYLDVVNTGSTDKYYDSGNGTWSYSYYMRAFVSNTVPTSSDSSTDFLGNYEAHYVNLWTTTNTMSSTFAVLSPVTNNYTLLYHDYASDTLTLVANSSGTGTMKIYVAAAGSPSTVTGCASWAYDGVNSVTITLSSGTSTTVMSWSGASGTCTAPACATTVAPNYFAQSYITWTTIIVAVVITLGLVQITRSRRHTH